jgi:cobalt-precorrin 5A hydrolase/precorrin-3B C17-methyltransferase
VLRVAVSVCPGLSALQAAAARVGAPLGHDFCTISLSDLLTPWPEIERRLHAAADGDFVVALYNPASARRRDQLGRALAILRAQRPPETPVIVARNLGRTDERVTIADLATMDAASVDMLTLLLVGSSNTRAFGSGAMRRVYTPRGYAAKREKVPAAEPEDKP